jgi:hypothetical protein
VLGAYRCHLSKRRVTLITHVHSLKHYKMAEDGHTTPAEPFIANRSASRITAKCSICYYLHPRQYQRPVSRSPEYAQRLLFIRLTRVLGLGRLRRTNAANPYDARLGEGGGRHLALWRPSLPHRNTPTFILHLQPSCTQITLPSVPL